MGRMNIYLDDEEDKKLDRLKTLFSINSKEEVIKRLIKQFPEQKKDLLKTEFDFDKETSMENIL
jgi:hypothetical protein